ncbi:sec23/Sec24 trunk domain-containing protein [Ditylenchus destructor]|nr:sec23/Sec24 trunk domain-containing protein [Ditylenchus destructor]
MYLPGGPPQMTGGPPLMNGGPRQMTGGPPQMTGIPPQMPGGPPQMNGGPRQMTGGPPQMTYGPSQMTYGSTQMTGGPPQMTGIPPQMTYGSPQMTGGPSQMTAGPPQMPGGPPQMTGGQPQMTGGPPQMTGGPPQMTAGPPQMPGGTPQMTGGQPQMTGGPPQLTGGPPQMSYGSPQMTGGPPQMSYGSPQMTGGPPQMTYGSPQMTGGPPQMTGGPPQMTGNPPQKTGGPQRLDPNMMPSVVQVIEDDRISRSGLFPTGYPHAELPPLVSTEFVAQDQGNCNPKFIRSTVYAIPQNNDMIKNSCLPISLSITAMASLDKSEIPPPVIDLGELGPVRCQRCKAYMCPFMEFVDGGRKFRCPFCRASTPVEEGYFAHLDHTGRRTDIAHRPELFLGSYEFVATKEYCKNGVKPKEPAFIFMLDVSYNANRNGLVELFCRNFIDILRNLPKDYGMDKSTVKIGLATYDNVIHFYNLSQHGKPEMLVVNDIADMFVPFAEGFLVDFEQAELSLSSCLAQIVNNFSDTRITETMLGPVIQAGLDALKNLDRAGKLFIFHTSLPTLEAPGQLKNREDRKLLGSDKEKTVLSPATEFYGKLGEECVKFGCAVDLFLFPNSFIDVASLVPVSHLTGGSIYKYQYFDCARDGVRFLSDLKHDVSREIVFDVMMRVRTSTGVRPTGFYGSFYMQNTTDIEMSAIDADKSVQVEIKYDDKLEEKEPVIFQAAVLFTSCGGQRRLRIHNLSLPVTTDHNQIYRLTDEDAIVTHLFKAAERTIREKSPKDMREEIVSICAHVLSTYREKCSETAPLGQLILPECLKLLPVHVNCITKNDSLNGGSELTVDDRAWMMSLVPSMTVQEVSTFLYPRVYPITGLSLDANDSSLQIPTQVRASIEYFSSEEAYLIENAMVAFIWIGQNISAEWLHNVFNANSFANLDAEKHDLPERDNACSRAVRQLFAIVNEGRPRNLKLFVIKQQEGLESWMKKFLVEDRYAANSMSYIEFLCQVHREIRSLLS